MKNFIFSALNNAFYPLSLKSRYIEAGSWPDDCVEVDDEVFQKYTGEPPAGKVRGVKDGLPCWIDLPPPTQEELEAINKQTQFKLRDIADSEIAWRQDAVESDFATEKEVTELYEWKKYRVLLMRIDTSAEQTIEWPTPPEASIL
nr:MAG TPA: tail fiber assembly protein [Caudoviricetes sp.]